MGFDTALIATGANVRRLRADGSELDGIHYIRALANSDSLREDAAGAEHVVLIGGSYIACEVAASLTASMGVRCSSGDDGERAAGAALRGRGGALLPARPRGARRGDPRRRRAGALRGRRRAGAEGGDRRGPRARLRLRGDRCRGDARRDAGPLGRPRAGRDRGPALLVGPRDLGAGGLRGRRQLRVRQPGARAPAAGGALGRGREPGQDRGAEHARARGGAHRGAVLLLGPRRLGVARVRGSRKRRARGARLDGRRRIHGLLSRRQPGDGGAWRWAGAPTTSSTPAASSPTGRRPRARRSPTRAPTCPPSEPRRCRLRRRRPRRPASGS